MYTSSFFNSVNGDRRYKADAFAEYFASFIGNGVFPVSGDASNVGSNLQIIAAGGMTLAATVGKAWINGYFFHNFDNSTVILATAHGIYDRIDRVVLRWSLAERSIDIAVKQGVYSSVPEPEPLRRDADIYELALADVLVAKGTITITQADITDVRLNSELCGIVKGTIEEIDTTAIFNQYNDWYNTFTEQAKSDFLEWFESIRDILDENTAAHLLNLINNKQDKITVNGLLKSGENGVVAAVPDVDYASGESLNKINRIVLSGNAEISDVVALTMFGTAERATESGFDTLTYDVTDTSLLNAPVSIAITDTKILNVFFDNSTLRINANVADISGSKVTYTSNKVVGNLQNSVTVAAGYVSACKYDTNKVCVFFGQGSAGIYYICISVDLDTNTITSGTSAIVPNVPTTRSNPICVAMGTNKIALIHHTSTETALCRCNMSALTIQSTNAASQTYNMICKQGTFTALSDTLAVVAGTHSGGSSYLIGVMMSGTSAVSWLYNATMLNSYGFTSPMIAMSKISANKALLVGTDDIATEPYCDRKAVVVDLDATSNITLNTIKTLRDFTKCSTTVSNLIDCGSGYFKAYSVAMSLIVKVNTDLANINEMRILTNEKLFPKSVPQVTKSNSIHIMTWADGANAGKQTLVYQYNNRLLGIVESKDGDELTIVNQGEYITSNLIPGTTYYLQRDGTIGIAPTFKQIGIALTNTRLLLTGGMK